MNGLFGSMASLVKTLFKTVFWYITRKRCEGTVTEYPRFRQFIPDKYKAQEMYERDVGVDPRLLLFVSNKYKTREMYEKAVEDGLWTLIYVPDWSVTQELIKIWHDNDDHCIDDDELFKW